jgi:hypothetical protein
MNTLSISFNGREIASGRLGSPMILIGRSPTCDLILRAKNVKPVHFLVEWVGVGEFGEDLGSWTVFDISRNHVKKETDSKAQGIGEGVIVGEKPVKIGEFEFLIRTDRLMETPLDGGILRKSFLEKNMAPSTISNSYQLEVVSIREDSGTITNVGHFDQLNGRVRKIVIPHIPMLALEWNSVGNGTPISIDATQLADAQLFRGKSALLNGHSEGPRSVNLTPGELVKIKSQDSDHYFRLVPKITVPAVPLSLLKDPFYRIVLGFLTLLVALFFVARNFDFLPAEPIKEPPRIAKVEVKSVDVKNFEVKEPAPTPIPAMVPPVAPEPDIVNLQKSVPAPLGELQPPPPAPANQKKSAGLNSPAPKANINSIGLLGALKSHKKGSVSADKIINDGIISNTVQGDHETFTVQQSPSGSLVQAGNTEPGLTEAYSSMEKTDSQTGKTVSVVTGAGKAGTGGTQYSKVNLDATNEFSTEGGLDKDSVRKMLLHYRKDIRTCYERALQTKPRITGRIVFKWKILGAGPVEWIRLNSSTVESPNLADCVETVVRSIKFPVAPNHQPTIVIYPFEFQTKI